MPVFSVYEQGGRSIRMQAVLSGVNMPVSTVKLGRQIKIQIIYNKGTSAFGKKSFSLSLSLCVCVCVRVCVCVCVCVKQA